MGLNFNRNKLKLGQATHEYYTCDFTKDILILMQIIEVSY